MLERYLVLKSTLGSFPDIEGQFQSYQEAADTMQKNIRTEYLKYDQAYGNNFVWHYDKDYQTGYLKATTLTKIEDYQIKSGGIVVAWIIQKINVPDQGNSTLFGKGKKAVRQDVFDTAQNIRFSTGQMSSLNDDEVDEVVNRLIDSHDVLYWNCLRTFVQEAINLHEQKLEISLELAHFRTKLAELITADPRDAVAFSKLVSSLNEMSKKIRHLFPDDPEMIPAALQPEFDQYAQLNAMLSAYLNSKAYCDIKEKKQQNRCDDSEQEDEE